MATKKGKGSRGPSESKNRLLDQIFIFITFGLFLTLGGIVLFFTFGTLSVLADGKAADNIIAGSYVAAILLSAILGMIAIGTTTYNRYPETCSLVCALGGTMMLGRIILVGGLAGYQTAALIVGALACFFGSFRYGTAKRFLPAGKNDK